MDHLRNKTTSEKIFSFLILLLLAVFLVSGLKLFRDYGASTDEINQIEAGHITWKAILRTFGKETPKFDDLPDLASYYNRYYGQAATFPTVIIEALRHFSMDKSSIIRLRHLWNFLVFFAGTACLTVFSLLRFQRNDVTFCLILLYILTPRLFGDAFYNDRDVMLISLMWISLLCFEFYRRRPGIFPAILCAFFIALAVNTRLFGMVLLLLPLFHLAFGRPGKKKYFWLIPLLTVFFWYLMTPVYWGNFLREFISGFRIFSSGTQRTQETGGNASVLMFGKYYKENALPFWYLPVWIFISTPLVPQIFTVSGLWAALRKKTDRTMDFFMAALLLGGVAAVMLIRPVLYTGWRHLFFFYVPFFYFAACGLEHRMTSAKKGFPAAAFCLVLVSALVSGYRIADLHPYEYLYLNSLFRNQGAEFDRDYWRLSTTECMEWLGEQETEEISIGEYNESLDNTVIGLSPKLRHRLNIMHFLALHRYPPEYLIFNYSGIPGNEHNIPFYTSVHSIERNGIRIAEIYRRTEAAELKLKKIIPAVPEIADGIPETQWRSSKPQSSGSEFILEFAEPVSLIGISVLPGDDEREYAGNPEILISDDGKSWTVLPVTVTGLFDLSFPEVRTSMLKLRNQAETDLYWSIRDILFYSPVN